MERTYIPGDEAYIWQSNFNHQCQRAKSQNISRIDATIAQYEGQYKD